MTFKEKMIEILLKGITLIIGAILVFLFFSNTPALWLIELLQEGT